MTDQGVVLYEGPTALRGQTGDVALIVTFGSANTKTGPLDQGWVIPIDQGDILPAVEQGRDGAVCGKCPHRPFAGGVCYVNVAWAPTGIYRAWKRGTYPKADPEELEYQDVRWGAWGDPAAVHLLARPPARTNIGYTQQWRYLGSSWRWCMASVRSPEEFHAAAKMGWRTLRTRAMEDDPLLEGEIACPAAAESNHATTCYQCRLCAPGSKVRHIAIKVHGVRSGAFEHPRQLKLWKGQL